jgi:hypothetical protein
MAKSVNASFFFVRDNKRLIQPFVAPASRKKNAQRDEKVRDEREIREQKISSSLLFTQRRGWKNRKLQIHSFQLPAQR